MEKLGKITREKVFMISAALASFLSSCHGPEAPNKDTIRKYFENHATAEKIDPTVLKDIKNAVGRFKTKSGDKEIQATGNLDYGLNIESIQAANDSTLYVNYLPIKEVSNLSERQKELADYTSEEVTFQNNGIVSIKLGDQRVTSEEVTEYVKDLAARVVMELDEETGGIVNYAENFSQTDDQYCYMKIDKNGEMKQGGNSTTERFPTAKEDVSKRMQLLRDNIATYLK